ncbi:MAG: hypothetical protein FJ109_08725 [Deltaproteobacteria bacterium]|nr:hypothetical protein [Deltaproteobacteria bacterium]
MDGQDSLLEQYLKAAKELAGLSAKMEKTSDAARKLGKLASTGRNLAVEGAEELSVVRKLLPELREGNLGGLLTALHDALHPLQQAAEAAAQKEVLHMLEELHRRLAAAGLTLDGRFPELSCGIFTLLFESTTKGLVASLYYGPRIARLEQVAGAEVDKVEKAILEARRSLEDGLLPPGRFLPALLDAWRMAHFRRGRNPEGPVPILAVLAELCFAAQEERFLRNPSKGTFRAYGQVSFSYQLFLSEERAADGMSLGLGIATREDVRDGDSLWVPRTARGEGVHYATLTFRRSE